VHHAQRARLPHTRTGARPRGALLAALLLAAAFLACSGGDDKSTGAAGSAADSGGTAADPAAALAGNYELVGDIGGTQVRSGARVVLTLKPDGTLGLVATQPGETVTDAGTWSLAAGKLTVAIKDLGVSAKDAAYSFDGTTLDLPVLIFGDGSGSSRWRRVGAVAAATSGTATTGADADPDTVAFTSGVQTNWQAYDLTKYATAAAMKAYLEAVNDRHLSLKDAVRAAADQARRFSTVADVTLSRNGLNATIRYRDGHEEELITERFTLEQAPALSAVPAANQLLAWGGAGRAAPATAATATCDELPAAPLGTLNTARGRIAEPGREGLGPQGGYGVVNYTTRDQPTPVSSADSPPAGQRRALLVAPLYRVPHPGPGYDRQDRPAIVTWTGFAAGSRFSLDCVEADLKRAGYAIDKISGRVDRSGKRVDTGLDALVALTKYLTTNEYGVVYFLTHGAEINERLLKLEMGALDEAERKKITGDGRLDSDAVLKLEATIRERVLREAGLPQDEDLKRTINARVEARGYIELWVSADFFRLLRERKGLDFSRTLVFVNACSSAANQSLRQAFEPRAYFGFDQPPDLDFAGSAANTIFDELPDRARSARNAWQMWARHESWIAAVARERAGIERPDRTKVERVKAYGSSGVAYPPLADQSVILIYRMRHGPPAGAERLKTSSSLVTNCWTTYWSAGKNASGLQAKACNDIELGSHTPTQDEYEDALFEATGEPARPYGRFTLTD
jgi:hypothetical protein